MPPRPPRQGLSTRQFAFIIGGILLLLTVFQLAQHRPQRFEPPPTSTSAEIGGDEPTPYPQPAADTPATTSPAPDSVPTSAHLTPQQIYASVDQMPEPPGGMGSLMQYLGQHIQYPQAALRNDVEGKVFVNFTIGPDGEVRDVRVAKGISAGCDEEAARVIRQMPRWRPGKQQGRPVSVAYTVPVTFSINRPAFLRFFDKLFHA